MRTNTEKYFNNVSIDTFKFFSYNLSYVINQLNWINFNINFIDHFSIFYFILHRSIESRCKRLIIIKKKKVLRIICLKVLYTQNSLKNWIIVKYLVYGPMPLPCCVYVVRTTLPSYSNNYYRLSVNNSSYFSSLWIAVGMKITISITID